ncbi:MAG: pyruvate oxidoreductase subunit gamma [bacterium]|nr:pyruvate oxidoreductase subunit gamma [bacterium]
MSSEKKYTEVIWYGRGGQGAITASQLIAEAASYEGYKGVTTAPSFGAERRGAPVAAFLRLSSEPIRIFSQIDDPDVIVVLDPTLLSILELEKRFKKEAVLIVNSTKTPEELGLASFKKVGIADVTATALENNLTMAGVAILNTPILGAFVKTTELVGMPSVERFINSKFAGEKAELNVQTARITFESTKVFDQ